MSPYVSINVVFIFFTIILSLLSDEILSSYFVSKSQPFTKCCNITLCDVTTKLCGGYIHYIKIPISPFCDVTRVL